MATGTFAHSS